MITLLRARRIISTVPKRYPPEFRRKVLGLVAAGRRVVQVASDLDISEPTIYVWRRQELIDTGQLPGASSTEQAELTAARRRIAQLEAEVGAVQLPQDRVDHLAVVAPAAAFPATTNSSGSIRAHALSVSSPRPTTGT